MSGSDPSISRARSTDSVASGTGGGSQAEECPGRDFETVLASPDPDAVAAIRKGDLLDIVSVDEPVRGVVARTMSGDTAGAVTRDILRLRSCMADGWMFEAEVREVLGGSVTIVIREQQ